MRIPLTLSVALTLAALTSSCADSPTAPEFGTPAALNVVAGALQSGVIGTDLQEPLAVRVLDARGRAVPAVQVLWTSVSGGAVVAPSASFTDSTGTAYTSVRLGESIGEQRVRASHGAVTPAEFILEALRHPATFVEVLSGSNQAAQVGATLPQPIVAQVLDAQRAPLAGIPVIFRTTSGTATPTADTSDANGIVSTSWTLGHIATYATLDIVATDGEAVVQGSSYAQAIGLPIAEIEILSGGAQTGVVSTTLPNTISVRFLAAGGVPIVGRTVWLLPSGNGSVPESHLATGGDGVVTTSWRLGTLAGQQRLRFTIDGDSVTVVATALPGAPASVQLYSGGGQSGPKGTALAEPIVATVVDTYQNPIPGVTVTFAAAAGSGSFAPASATTDSLGRAASSWTLGDALGAMTGSLSVAGGLTVGVTAVGAPSVQILQHRVLDAEFHEGTNRLVTVSESPRALHIVNPQTGAETSITLPAAPTAVSIAPNGSRAAVGHDGFVTIVDLDAAAVVQTWPVGTDALDLMLAGNGYAYILPRRDQWVEMHSLEVATGTVTRTGQFYAGALGRLHPSGDYLYLTDNGISPADIEKFDIRGGIAVPLYDSRYHGFPAMGGNLWYSTSGDRIYTARATVFTSTASQATDIEYLTTFAGTFGVQWVAHSDAVERVAALSRVEPWNAPPVTTIRVYSSTFLNYLGSLPLPRFPRSGAPAVDSDGVFTFFSSDGQTLYVLLRAPDSAGVLLNSALSSYTFAEFSSLAP